MTLHSFNSIFIKHVTDIYADKSSVLAACYFPAVDLSDGNYELGLTDFETYHTISNVNLLNNKFYFDEDDKEIVVPEESNT